MREGERKGRVHIGHLNLNEMSNSCCLDLAYVLYYYPSLHIVPLSKQSE